MTTIPEINNGKRGRPRAAEAAPAEPPMGDVGTLSGKLDGPPVQIRAVIAVMALVALADFLFWGQAVGLSLAVFALAVFAAAAIGRPWRDVPGPAAITVLGVLPVLHYVQPLSVALLVIGPLTGIAWLRLRRSGRVREIVGQAMAMVLAIPSAGLRDLRRMIGSIELTGGPGRPDGKAILRAWALPIGGTLVLLTLLTDANPILADWLAGVLDVEVDWVETVRRTLFWIGVAMGLWPMVGAQLANLSLPRLDRAADIRLPMGLNTGSVLRALVLFNLVLAVQTGMDAALLWGGTGLPPGMSYAEYAHRGAYPLLLTALLAGAFALAARPFLDENRLLRPLVFVWLAQNVALCLSSARRLDLYIEAFGLTYLRLYVIIWIIVVGVGLCLTAWQIWRRRPNAWLLVRSALLGLAVLYVAAFVNFAHIIAERNVRMPPQQIDWAYLCDLPDVVVPLIRQSKAFARAGSVLPPNCGNDFHPIDGWRDWSFRRWRAAVTMQANATAERADEDIGGR
ncbi:MAG: DUF4173 domain-containing protein [Pseudomonadota bacterium]